MIETTFTAPTAQDLKDQIRDWLATFGDLEPQKAKAPAKAGKGKATAKSVGFDEVKAAADQLTTKKLVSVLREFGVEKQSALPPDQYADALEAMKQAAAE